MINNQKSKPNVPFFLTEAYDECLERTDLKFISDQKEISNSNRFFIFENCDTFVKKYRYLSELIRFVRHESRDKNINAKII